MKDQNNYIGGIRKETYDLLFKNENLPESYGKDKNSDKILYDIENFTKCNANIENNAISYNDKNKNYEYHLEDRVIPFEMFSDSIKNEKLKKELLSNERYGKCHKMVIGLIRYLKNPATILTGVCERHGKNFLHSVIEIQTKNGIKIIDYTLNIIMPKQIYIELTNFQEIETIKDIEMLEDEKDGILNFLADVNSKTKPYLGFRQEMSVDLKKNKTMLETVDNKELNSRIEEVKKQRKEFERE